MTNWQQRLAGEWIGRVVADRSTAQVVGPEAASWFNGMITCEVPKLPEGDAGYGFCVNKVGKIQADAWVVKQPEGLWISFPKAVAEGLVETLDGFLIMEDAEIESVSEGSLHWLEFLGAGAYEQAQALASELAGKAFRWHGVAGLEGALVVTEKPVPDVADRGAAWLSQEQWQQVIGALGWPQFGLDFGDHMYPQETGLESAAVDFDKGCYLGQEVVCMLQLRGKVKRRLYRVSLESAPEPGADVVRTNGKSAGTIVRPLPDGDGAVGGEAVALLKTKFVDEQGLSVEGAGGLSVVSTMGAEA